MDNKKQKLSKLDLSRLLSLFTTNSLRNAVLFSGGIILFLAGTIFYGIILNLRENSLSEELKGKGFEKFEKPNILIDRKSFSLTLYEDTVAIKMYRASFGKNLSESKTKAEDNATPVGVYAICDLDSNHQYHKFLKINYPNVNDASEALRKGWINQKQFEQLKFEFYYAGCPNPNTVLGGNLGIHGIGKFDYILKNLPFVYNWTNGSIAISNEAIDEIFSVVQRGTKVVIK
ncbi:MAG: L,D-transpeptidase [Ignavibacteriaceae bacterium]|nr:L,D-transpeptidase [Ignavibacteriaceae bacterium]